jgi:hypothetical protein
LLALFPCQQTSCSVFSWDCLWEAAGASLRVCVDVTVRSLARKSLKLTSTYKCLPNITPAMPQTCTQTKGEEKGWLWLPLAEFLRWWLVPFLDDWIRLRPVYVWDC